MTPQRILMLNATATAASAILMLAARGMLYPWFGLDEPLLLDVIAVAFLGYAVALAIAARHEPVSRQALIVFTAADATWVAGSALVLVLFWAQLTPLARLIVIAVALVVELFATLQFRAAGRVVDARWPA